jgi:hypothetical protein
MEREINQYRYRFQMAAGSSLAVWKWVEKDE